MLYLALTPAFAAAQWTRTNGLESGGVSNFTIVGDTIVALVGQLYYSVDRGENWTAMASTPGDFASEIRYFEGELLLKCSDHSLSKPYLWRSADFGATWSSVALADSMRLYHFFKLRGKIYGTDNRGIYRTDNNGASWTYLTKSPINKCNVERERITAVSSNSLIQSVDGGFEWDTLFQPLTGNVSSLVQQGDTTLMFMSWQTPGIWITKDNGTTWNYSSNSSLASVYKFFWHNGALIGIDFSKMYRSSNLGLNWQVTYPGITENAFTAGISGGGDTILLGTIFTGIQRQNEPGKPWQAANKGISNACPDAFFSSDSVLYAAYATGLWKLDEDGLNWRREPIDLPTPITKYIGPHDYIEQDGHRIIIYGNQIWVHPLGGNWQMSIIKPEHSSSFASLQYVNGGIVAKSYGDWESHSLYLSIDKGLTFNRINPFYNQQYLSANNTWIDDGNLYLFDPQYKIFRSSDGGGLWEHVTTVPVKDYFPNPSPSPLAWIRQNAVLIKDNTPTVRNILFSPDFGVTWYYSDLAAEGKPWGKTRLWNMLEHDGSLVLSTNNGIYVSNDGGLTWSDWSDGLDSRMVNTLEVYGAYLWAGLLDYGIWKRPLAELKTMVATDEFHRQKEQLVIYPNPGNGSAIHIVAPEPGMIRIWDVLGRVKFEQEVPQGTSRLLLSELPSGYYHVILQGQNNRYALNWMVSSGN